MDFIHGHLYNMDVSQMLYAKGKKSDIKLIHPTWFHLPWFFFNRQIEKSDQWLTVAGVQKSGLTKKGHKNMFGWWNISVLIVVVLTWLYAFYKTHRTEEKDWMYYV